MKPNNDVRAIIAALEEFNVGGFRRQPRRGDRVWQFSIIDREPDFLAKPGGYGFVTQVEMDGPRVEFISVKMDDPIKGAEEWDNEIYFQDDSIAEFFFSFALRHW